MGPPKPRLARCYSVARKEFSYRKPVCPFISSTFVDFQEEREFLMRKVFPTIGALCHERGTYCAPVDLRWGINENQANSGLVVQLCLDYIVRCAPFFICLLGERYGCQRPEDAPPLPKTYEELPPDASWLDKSLMVAAAAGYDWVLQKNYQHCSVTELEIIQAAFLGDTADYCYFYFRQPDHVEHLYLDLPEEERQQKLAVFAAESDYSNLRVRDLKARIVNKGLPIRYYQTPEELGRMVLEDWTRVVESLYTPLQEVVGTTTSEMFREWMAHETFAETRRQIFICPPELEALLEEMNSFALSALDPPPPDMATDEDEMQSYSFSNLLRKKNESAPPCKYQSILLLMGERGSGKTALVSNWVKEFKEEHHPSLKVFSHYIGSSAQSTDITSLLRRCTLCLRDEYPDHTSADSDIAAGGEEVSDFHHVCEAFLAAVALGPCVLIIDGVDELGETYGRSSQQVKEMTWLPYPLPPQCKVIISSARSDSTYHMLASRADTKVVKVPLLTDTKVKKKVIREYLAIHCKCLTDQQLDKVVSCKLSDRPLFLSALANELRVFGVNSHLDYHLDSYLETGSMQEVWSRIIQRWVKDYSWTTTRSGSSSVGTVAEGEAVELTGWVADALRLIAVSRNGLSQAEILELLTRLGYQGDSQVNSFDWALFRSAAMDGLFERPGGLLNFFHQHFKEAAEFTLLGSVVPESPAKPCKAISLSQDPQKVKSSADRATFHKHLADFFQSLDTSSERRRSELPWQLERAGEYERLRQFLMEPKIFMDMCGDRLLSNRRLELLQYWKTLTEAGYSPAATYWQMLKQAGITNEDASELGEEDAMELNGEEAQETEMPSHQSFPGIVPKIFTTGASTCSDLWGEELELGSQQGPPSDWLSMRVRNNSLGASRMGQDMEDLDDAEQEVKSTSSQLSERSGSTVTCSTSMSDEELAKLANCAGQFLSIMGHFSEAEQMLLMAYNRLSQMYPLAMEYELVMSQVEEGLGNLYLFQLRQSEAAHWYHRALDAVCQLIDSSLEPQDVSSLLETKGRLMDHLGHMKTFGRRFVEAERLLMQAKTCFENAGSLTGKAFVQYHIGVLRLHQGQFDKAESHLLRAMTALERWYGKSHPRVADALNDLGGLLSNPKNQHGYDLEQAETLYRRALNIREKIFGCDHLLVATTLFHLGKLLKEKRSGPARSEAATLLQRSLDIRTTKLGTDHKLTKCVRRVLSHLEIQIQISQTRRSIPGGSTHPWAAHKRSSTAPASQSHHRKHSWKNHSRRLSFSKKRDGEQGMVVATENGEELVEDGTEDEGHQKQPEVFLTSGEELEDEVVEEDVQNGGLSLNHGDYGVNLGLLAIRKGETSTSKNVTVTTSKCSDVIDNYASLDHQTVDIQTPLSAMSLTNSQKKREQVKTTHVQTTLQRPKSAPLRQSASFTMGQRRSAESPKRLRRLQSAPPKQYSSQRQTTAHRKTCYQPGPHTIDVHNAYSTVNGPNASINSLLGPPQCPRPSSGIIHQSAWYQVPGRYATSNQPYPPKRLQKRVRLKAGGIQTKSLPDFGLQGQRLGSPSHRPDSVSF